MRYQLFRILVTKKLQEDLFGVPSSDDRAEIILNTLQAGYLMKSGQNSSWVIGNVNAFNGLASFHFGKVKRQDLEKYNDESRTFEFQETDNAESTLCVWEHTYNLLSIGQNTRVSGNIKSISRALEQFLNEDQNKYAKQYEFKIAEIDNPESFLKIVNDALAIKSFTVQVGRVNPWDVEDAFHKPLQQFNEQINAKRSTTTFVSSALNKDGVSELTKSAVSVGNKPKMKYVDKKTNRSMIKSVGDKALIFNVEDNQKFDALEIKNVAIKIYENIKKVIF